MKEHHLLLVIIINIIKLLLNHFLHTHTEISPDKNDFLDGLRIILESSLFIKGKLILQKSLHTKIHVNALITHTNKAKPKSSDM